MAKLSKQRFHLVFSFVMAFKMVLIMTFVVTAANVGFPEDFLGKWAHAFLVAYVVAVPVIYFVAPVARKLTARWVELP